MKDKIMVKSKEAWSHRGQREGLLSGKSGTAWWSSVVYHAEVAWRDDARRATVTRPKPPIPN